ncbi:MAG TPA: hypothetical protein EYN18_04930, partial [Nitrospirales bacterium]|nr:hypothetical protein [Nitrospirales bacterium]
MDAKTLDVLDLKVKELLQVVQNLKRKNALMTMQLEKAESGLKRQADEVGRWEAYQDKDAYSGSSI